MDLEGNVCLNILREDWKPVLNLNSVMVGLQYLFLEPNADDPLNKGKPSMSFTRNAGCEKRLSSEIKHPFLSTSPNSQRRQKTCAKTALFSPAMSAEVSREEPSVSRRFIF